MITVDTKKGRNLMAQSPRYDEEFKKSLITLHNNGSTQTALFKEYGVSMSALGKWIRMYS